MVEFELAFTEVSETSFVHHRGSCGPCLAQVELLGSRAVVRAKAGYVRSRCLEVREGTLLSGVIEEIVKAQLVRIIEPVVDLGRTLDAATFLNWNQLKLVEPTVRLRHILIHEVDRGPVKTLTGNLVVWKDRSPGCARR